MQDASSHGLPSRGNIIEGADMKLTQKAIAALVLPEGKTDHIEWDSDLPGFGIRIRAGGARTWIYQYKIGNQNRDPARQQDHQPTVPPGKVSEDQRERRERHDA